MPDTPVGCFQLVREVDEVFFRDPHDTRKSATETDQRGEELGSEGIRLGIGSGASLDEEPCMTRLWRRLEKRREVVAKSQEAFT